MTEETEGETSDRARRHADRGDSSDRARRQRELGDREKRRHVGETVL